MSWRSSKVFELHRVVVTHQLRGGAAGGSSAAGGEKSKPSSELESSSSSECEVQHPHAPMGKGDPTTTAGETKCSSSKEEGVSKETDDEETTTAMKCQRQSGR